MSDSRDERGQPGKLTEAWAKTPDVQRLLEHMLAEPTGDHSVAVAAALDGGPLRTAHEISLLRASLRLDSGKQNQGASGYAAYHTWLYHFLGGSQAKLVPPPTSTVEVESRWSRINLYKVAKRAEAKYSREVDRLRRSGGQQLQLLRCSLVDPSVLRPVDRPVVAAPGSAPPPAGSDAESAQQTARLLAFAMGTHPRLGYGYASREEPCGVRLVGNNSDVLRIIAAFVRDLPPPTLAPPDPELLRLRAQNVEKHTEVFKLRELLDEYRGRVHELERSEVRALRHVDCARRREQESDERAEEMRREFVSAAAAFRAKLSKEFRQELAKERCEHKREVRVLQLQFEELAREYEADVVLRSQNASHDRSAELGEMKQLRDEAEALAGQLEQELDEQAASLERLRVARNGSALQRMGALEEENRRLKERRKAGQRTLQDAALDRRRAQQAVSKAKQLESAFSGAAVRAEAAQAGEDLERVPQLEAELVDVRAQLAEAEAARDKYKAIAEPEPRFFRYQGHISAHFDRAGIEALQLGVSCGKLPRLFRWAARTFGVKIPTREIAVSAKKVDGKMTYAKRDLTLLPGVTHCKFLRAVMAQINKLQAAEWMGDLLKDQDEHSSCYIADGAESQQHEWLAQMLSKRLPDGQLDLMAIDMAVMGSKTAEAQAARFREALEEIAAMGEKAGLLDKERADRLRKFVPTCGMNDRAANARKATRLILGLADGDDDPTCSEHALVNILEEGRKAIDAVVRRLMNISDEQAAADSEKVKALRTVVGWFSSPACSLIFMVQKYIALCSSKGYAIGQKAAEWLEAEMYALVEEQAELEGELYDHVEDVQAIRGSRNYVFYLDAPVTDRLLQERSLGGYLQEETDLAESSAGGKLRNAILTGKNSSGAMAAVRAMSIVGDAVMMPALRALKPGADKRVLDVLPDVWPQIHRYFKEAAADAASVVEGSLHLHSRLGLEVPTEAPSKATRGGRARLDMLRIRGASIGDALVEEMVAAAMAAMAPATENHAAEWLPGGKLCKENLTPALFARYDALVASSSCVERVHAVGKANDERSGSQREDTRIGMTLARVNDQSSYLQSKEPAELDALMRLASREAAPGYGVTIKATRLKRGIQKRAGRQERLKVKRAKREAAAAEQRRVEALAVATRYSELTRLDNPDLTDQLRWHKQAFKKEGKKVDFTVTGNRTALVLRLQKLLTEAHGTVANDLAAGDDGTEKASDVPRKRRAEGAQAGGKKKKTTKRRNDCGDEWSEDEEFEVEAILATKISKGKAGGDRGRKGETLYYLAWKGYSADASTWERAADIHPEIISDYMDGLQREAEADAAAEAELEDSDDDSDTADE